MTLKELSQLFHLGKEIEENEQRLKDIEDSLTRISAPDFEEHSHTTGYVQSKIDKLTAEKIDLQNIIDSMNIQCRAERNRLMRYIRGIKDSYTRRVFTLRFVDGLTWLQVAQKIGRGDADDAMRMICVRYLKEQNEGKKKK